MFSIIASGFFFHEATTIKDPDPHQADTDPHQADTDQHQADTDQHQADTDPHQADTDPYQADTDPYQAETDPHQADKDRHIQTFLGFRQCCGSESGSVWIRFILVSRIHFNETDPDSKKSV